MDKHNPIVSALRSQLKTQPRNERKRRIMKSLEGVRYE